MKRTITKKLAKRLIAILNRPDLHNVINMGSAEEVVGFSVYSDDIEAEYEDLLYRFKLREFRSIDITLIGGFILEEICKIDNTKRASKLSQWYCA